MSLSKRISGAQRLVIAATDDPAVNRAVAAAAEARDLLVNVVDDAELSTAIMPAIVDRSPLMIAISSGASAPMLARRVREQLEALLDQSWGRVALLLGAWRSRIRARFQNARQRRSFYRELLDGPIAGFVRAGREADAERALTERSGGACGRRARAAWSWSARARVIRDC